MDLMLQQMLQSDPTKVLHLCCISYLWPGALESVVRPVIPGSLSRVGNDPQKKPFICWPALHNNLGTAFKLSLAPCQDALVGF